MQPRLSRYARMMQGNKHAFVTSPAVYSGWVAPKLPSGSLFCGNYNSCKRTLLVTNDAFCLMRTSTSPDVRTSPASENRNNSFTPDATSMQIKAMFQSRRPRCVSSVSACTVSHGVKPSHLRRPLPQFFQCHRNTNLPQKTLCPNTCKQLCHYHKTYTHTLSTRVCSATHTLIPIFTSHVRKKHTPRDRSCLAPYMCRIHVPPFFHSSALCAASYSKSRNMHVLGRLCLGRCCIKVYVFRIVFCRDLCVALYVYLGSFRGCVVRRVVSDAGKVREAWPAIGCFFAYAFFVHFAGCI